MASVFITVWDSAREVALGDPIQYAQAVIDSSNSSAISGSGKKRKRCRLYAEADCWVAWGASPTATGVADSIPLGPDNPEYVDIEAGHIVTAITRN